MASTIRHDAWAGVPGSVYPCHRDKPWDGTHHDGLLVLHERPKLLGSAHDKDGNTIEDYECPHCRTQFRRIVRVME